MTHQRLAPKERKAAILNSAIELSLTMGYANVRTNDIADHVGCSYGLVSHYFGTVKQMRRAIMRAAVKRELHRIIVQGLACADPDAMKAPAELIEAARASL